MLTEKNLQDLVFRSMTSIAELKKELAELRFAVLHYKQQPTSRQTETYNQPLRLIKG